MSVLRLRPDLKVRHILFFWYYLRLEERERARNRNFRAWLERPLPEENPPPIPWDQVELGMDHLIAQGKEPNLRDAYEVWMGLRRHRRLQYLGTQMTEKVDRRWLIRPELPYLR